jgi:hypothetical protein
MGEQQAVKVFLWRLETGEACKQRRRGTYDTSDTNHETTNAVRTTESLSGLGRMGAEGLSACLDSKYFSKFHYAKRRFPITSKYRHMHGVLNIDEIKN